MRHFVVLALALVVLAAGAGSSFGANARPLVVRSVPLPRLSVLRDKWFVSEGRYPRVFGGDVDLRAVNRAIRGQVLREEVSFYRAFEHWNRMILGGAPSGTGGFSVAVDRRLVTANTAVVSALLPIGECFPGGVDCDYWLSVTVRVPGGATVALPQLFRQPASGLRALAEQAKRLLSTPGNCAGRYPMPSGYAPRWSNYQHFALTSRGLVIGFDNSQVTGPWCGRLTVVIPYPKLSRHLSPLAHTLVSAIR